MSLIISRCHPSVEKDKLIWEWKHRDRRYRLTVTLGEGEATKWQAILYRNSVRIWSNRQESLSAAVSVSRKHCESLGSGSWQV